MSELAIDGGQAVRNTPFPTWPAPGPASAQAITQMIASGRINYWTGTCTRELEDRYAQMLGREHALAVANGTVALELALHAMGIGAGDEVIVPARTFIATAGAVVSVGARPVVADIDRDSGNLNAETVEPLLSPATRAVIAVHLGGWPVDMDPLLELLEPRGIALLEDAAQAHGGMYRGRPVGRLGSVASAFSFCNDKIISAGEGGLLALDDEDAFRRAWSYRDHGKSYQRVMEQADDADTCSYRWLVDSFGTNWRLPELCAPLVTEGLDRLTEWHAARTQTALHIARSLEDIPGLRIPLPADGVEHAFYRLYAYVVPERLTEGWDRDRITRAIAAEGVPCQYGTCAEIYKERAFTEAGFAPEHRLPVASELHETSLAFFVHPTLGQSEADDTVAAVRKVMEVACR